MKNIAKTIILSAIVFLMSITIRAQITVGSTEAPAKGALLQIKEYPTDTDNANVSSGGITLPRVLLENLSTLSPFISTSDPDYAKQALLHQGLTVYNLTIDETKGIYPGMYVWSGQQWYMQVAKTANFYISLSADELIFPSGIDVPITAQNLTINWLPTTRDCSLTLVNNKNGGISGYTPTTPISGGNQTISISVDPIPSSYLTADRFMEKVSTLSFLLNDGGLRFRTEQVKIRQIHYALYLGDIELHPELGKSYTTTLASNTDWVVDVISGDASIFSTLPTSGDGDETDQNFTYSIVNDNSKEGASATIRFSNPAGKFPSQTYTITATRNYPNCYIVPTGGSIEIPVRKAYRMWKKDFNIDLSGTLTSSLVWQDENGLIVNNISIAGTGIDAVITVNTTPGKTGNAVIALNVDGEISWSWHLWVTDYDPDSAVLDSNSDTKSFDVPNGKVYRYNNTDRASVFMDRNLGAINATKGNIGSLGQFYQWGRKDPYTNSATLPSYAGQGGTERTLYTITGGTTSYTYSPTNLGENLSRSIKNPTLFIGGSGVNNLDWYSATPGLTRLDLWSVGTWPGKKGDYDPCPHGWRVPPGGLGLNDPIYGLVLPNGDIDGYVTTELGFIPKAGYRYIQSKNIHSLGGSYYLASATGISQNSFLVNGSNNVRHGWTLRCIKDN